MNTILACIFPETQPDAGLLAPLVQVFNQVVHMQAVENEPPATDSTFLNHSRKMGRLRSFTPAPLGQERDRFMALIEDMRRNGADYTTQLSMLTLAGMPRGGRQRESTSSLISDLLKRTDIRTQEAAQLQLWQSRLMLKLGEFFDAQQMDIGSALSHISARQQDLFQELREEEVSFSPTGESRQVSAESQSMLQHRLKAWARLYFHDQVQAPALLITQHALALELLQEAYEKLSQQEAVPLISLVLPQVDQLEAPSLEPLIQELPRLQTALAQLSSPLSRQMTEKLAADLSNERAAWEALVEQHFPAAQTGRSVLEIIYFPDISADRLFMEGLAAGTSNATQEEGCCLGLLKEVLNP